MSSAVVGGFAVALAPNGVGVKVVSVRVRDVVSEGEEVGVVGNGTAAVKPVVGVGIVVGIVANVTSAGITGFTPYVSA
jgi:hydroxyethylthiazole kinase-like sugar kinase family protein